MKKLVIALLISGFYGISMHANTDESFDEPETNDASLVLDSDVDWMRGGRGGGNGRGHNHEGGNGRGSRRGWGNNGWYTPSAGFYETWGRRDFIYAGQTVY